MQNFDGVKAAGDVDNRAAQEEVRYLLAVQRGRSYDEFEFRFSVGRKLFEKPKKDVSAES